MKQGGYEINAKEIQGLKENSTPNDDSLKPLKISILLFEVLVPF